MRLPSTCRVETNIALACSNIAPQPTHWQQQLQTATVQFRLVCTSQRRGPIKCSRMSYAFSGLTSTQFFLISWMGQNAGISAGASNALCLTVVLQDSIKKRKTASGLSQSPLRTNAAGAVLSTIRVLESCFTWCLRCILQRKPYRCDIPLLNYLIRLFITHRHSHT